MSEYQNHTIENFVNCFKAYDLPQSLEDKQCKNYDIEQGKEEFQAYNTPGISKRNVFRACLSREVLLFKRNCPVHMFKAIQLIFLAFVIAALPGWAVVCSVFLISLPISLMESSLWTFPNLLCNWLCTFSH